LNASLDTIRKAAAELIAGIDKHYQALAKERGTPTPPNLRFGGDPGDLSAVTDESGAEQNLNMINGVVINEPPKAEETPPEAAPEITAPVPDAGHEPPSESAVNTADPDILAGYARYAEIHGPRQVGLTILMPLLYEDGNLNRESKRSRVKVEPPIGKYEIFSRDIGTPPYQTNYLYLRSASGYLVQLGETERLKDLTEQKLDTFVLDAITKLDRQLSDEAEWADFTAAALTGRIDEAEAHNRPVRELRETEYRAEHTARIESEKRLAAEKQQILTARVDEIAKAVETGSRIQVTYSAGEHQGKNPVLELFKLYGVEIPLRTQGWVNNRLATISGDSYSYYKQNDGKPSTAFMNCLHKLTAAVKQTPIEQMRGMPPAAKAVENTEVKDTLEHRLYEKFAAMFPEFMSGEYDTLRLEAEHAKPLVLEWVFGVTVSIAHTYELEPESSPASRRGGSGEPAYEPRVMLKVNSEAKTMTAYSLELSEPQRTDNVYDSRGNANLERQRNINDFTLQWLDRAEKQRFRPVEATYCVDEQGKAGKAGLVTGKTVKVTFDAEGRPVMPGPEKELLSVTAGSVYAEYCNIVAEKAAAYAVSSGTLHYDDESAARRSCDEIVNRVANDMLLSAKGAEHYRLYRQYADNADFKARLEDYVFVKAWLEPKSAKRAAEPSKPNPMFPDPTVTPAERDAYGYTESDMHPLGRDKALELFDAGQTVYLLFPDNTEAMAFDRDEIITFTGDGGLCGVSHADWQFSGEFKTQAILSGFREDALESDLLFGGESKFGIYQIPDYIADYRDFRFASMRELEARGLTPDRNNYKLVYTAPLTIHDTQINANKIFTDFQHDSHECPSDFTGRSLSVSDVVVLQWRGEVSAHFVDSIGFKELPIFTGNEREQKPPETLLLIETNSKQKHAGPQKPAGQKPPDTLLGELAEAKDAVARGDQPGAHKPNEREV
jgi:hypothetical protein